jgi:uncharacterized protein involved in exopolysaccharide biosynthesis
MSGLGALPPTDWAASPGSEGENGVLGTAVLFLRYRWVFAGMAFGLMLLGALSGLLRQRTYMATAAFLPQVNESSSARMAGLAAQFGIDIGGGAPETPQLYAALLTSRTLLERLVDMPLVFGDGAARTEQTLVEILNVSGDTPQERRAEAVKYLRANAVSAKADYETGMVLYTVSLPDPALAEEAAARMLALVGDFNLTIRQSRAGQERDFTRQRVEELGRDLRIAEDRLQGFLQANRRFEQSAKLAAEHERLHRDVVMRQGLYSQLLQSYEQARIEAARDIPVLTVLESPEGSARPKGRGTVLRGMVGFVLGLMLALGVATVLDGIRRSREVRSPEFMELVALRDRSRRRSRRPATPA